MRRSLVLASALAVGASVSVSAAEPPFETLDSSTSVKADSVGRDCLAGTGARLFGTLQIDQRMSQRMRTSRLAGTERPLERNPRLLDCALV